MSAGEGTKGARLFDWAHLGLADPEADECRAGSIGLRTRGLLIRRNIADGAYAFFTAWCPAATGIETLVAVEGRRWMTENSFEAAKNELGLGHNESRSWHGWHRHVSLAMLAFAMMASIRHHASPAEPRSGSRAPAPYENGASPDSAAPCLVRWSLQEIRRVATRLAQQRIRPAHVICGEWWISGPNGTFPFMTVPQ